MANRFDVSSTKKWSLDKRGRLIVEATPTRAGIFTYYERTDSGKIQQVKELRHPDDVFSNETMESLNTIPYTVQSNHTSLFTTKDATGKTYGYTMSNAKRVDGDLAHVKIKVHDQSEIDAITGGQSLELSNGYTCDIDKTPGSYKGQRYDQRQINIIYDHVARVENARGGESCRIRLDSNESAISGIEAERIDSDDVSGKPDNEDKIMSKIKQLAEVKIKDFRLDSDEIEFPADQEGVVNQLLKREDSYKNALQSAFDRLDASDKEATKYQAKVDTLTNENKELKKQVEDSIPSEKLDSFVEERSGLISMSKEYDIEVKRDMSNREIKRNIVAKVGKCNKERLDEESYLDAAFDQIDHEYEKKRLDADKKFEQVNPDKKVSSFDDAKKRRAQ